MNKKAQIFSALAAILLSLVTFSSHAGELLDKITEDVKQDTELAKQKIKQYIDKVPAIGFLQKKVKFDGIELSHFTFENGERVVVCMPGQKVNASVKYKIRSNELPSFHSHHLVVGLHPHGPQKVLAQNFGLFDSTDKTSFHLAAPQEKGVYEVRFCHVDGPAIKETWKKEGNPPSNTIMGFLIVQ